MKTARDTGMATSKVIREVADLLALGYLRYRQRAAGEAARMARESRVGSTSNPLDDVRHRANLRPRDRRISKTETGP